MIKNNSRSYLFLGGMSVATIKDIAKLANVSAATVSNVLNGKAGAACPEKTQEIFDTAKLLNYRPNYMAKNLKSKRSSTIGVITEDLTVHQTPEIVNGIEEYCEKKGYEILLANMRLFKRYGNNFNNASKNAKIFDNLISGLLAKQVEGIIYIGYHCRQIQNILSDTSIPIVYAYCIPKDQQHPYVLFDDESAAFEIGNVLITKGHRNIGLVSGPEDSINSRSRLRGFQRALFSAGIPYNVFTTYLGDWSRESGYAAAEPLLAQNVTAIFAFSDLMASGIMAYCHDHNLIVGKDISLFGYDNSNLVDAYSPSLSSVAPPLNEMGHVSAEQILSLIRGEKVPNQCTYLPCQVHVRDSVAEFN